MNQRKIVFIFINGILNHPEDLHGWTDEACGHVAQQTVFDADRYEYFTMPLLRPFKQAWRAKQIALLVEEWVGYEIVLVGHSNGCDLICRYLKTLSRKDILLPKILQVHLIAGATDCSCKANGLNEVLKDGILGSAYIYCSLGDRALQKAKGWTGWLRRFGLGYGWLGLGGPSEIDPDVLHKIHVIRNDMKDHGTWLAEDFTETLEGIVRYAAYS